MSRKPKSKPSSARKLNQKLRRREAEQVATPAKPLASATPAVGGVALVIVDQTHPTPYLVKWNGGEEKFASAGEANLGLRFWRDKKPELWVKARQT